MGLSDEERYEGACFAIERLNSVAQDWERDLRDSAKSFHPESDVRLRAMVKRLWHVFFGSLNNGLHWIMGSSSSNEITTDYPRTPWEIAVVNHLSKHVEHQHPWRDREDYDPMNSASIDCLLGGEWMWSKYVYEIYQWAEQLIYYLRRYNDDFLSDFVEVSNVASEIFGECFSVFKREEIFAKAYVVHQIAEHLYGNPLQIRDDRLARIIIDDGEYHISHLMKWALSDLCPLHIELEKARAVAQKRAEQGEREHEYYADPEWIKTRLVTFAKIRGNFISEHSAETVRNAFPELADAFDAAIKESPKVEKRRDDPYYMRGLNAYGHRGYFQLNDHLRDVFPEEEQPDEDADGEEDQEDDPEKENTELEEADGEAGSPDVDEGTPESN